MTKRSVLVDTQLLVLLTVGATKPELIARHKRTKGAYTRTDFDLLLDLLGFAPRFVYCAHVASEVSNLVAQYGEPDRKLLLAVLEALLRNATEVSVASEAALDQPEYRTLGLADAAQLALCSRDAVLLTDDEPLFRAASARMASAIYFSEEKFRRRRFIV